MGYKPLPVFQDIGWNQIKPLSIILEVGANKLTQWGEHAMGWIYEECYTHAMSKVQNNDILSMGFNAKIISVDKLSRSHKYTIITYNDLTQEQIDKGIQWCYDYVKNNKYRLYDVMGYLGMLTRIVPALRKIKWLHGSKSGMFCSDLEVHKYQNLNYPLYDGCDSEMIAPTDLFMMNSVWKHAYFNNLVL
jgi:hypothetical protein